MVPPVAVYDTATLTESPVWSSLSMHSRLSDVVVFGHTHKPFCEKIGNALFFNPGYAGKPRFNLPRNVAVLHCDTDGITADFLEL